MQKATLFLVAALQTASLSPAARASSISSITPGRACTLSLAAAQDMKIQPLMQLALHKHSLSKACCSWLQYRPQASAGQIAKETCMAT